MTNGTSLPGIQVEIEGLPKSYRVIDVADHPFAVHNGGMFDGDNIRAIGRGIVDIGCANFEFYRAISKVLPHDRVLAFDPMETYGPDKPLFYKVAVVAPDLATTGQIEFVESERRDSHAIAAHGIGDRITRPLRRMPVPCVGIDKVLTHRVKILKMDCEGAEFDILDWVFAQTAALADQITVELHPMLLSDDERDDRVRNLIDRAKRLYWQGVIRNSDTHLLLVAKDLDSY